MIKEVSKIGMDSRSADEALDNAKGVCEDVLIIGYDLDGDLCTFSSSGLTKAAQANFIIDSFKQALIAGDLSE